MSTLSEMPVVTVEQIVRFREAALQVEKERNNLMAWQAAALEIYPNTDRLIAIRTKAVQP